MQSGNNAPIDDKALHELTVESQDLQTDALRSMKGSLDDLADVRADRRTEEVDPAEIDRFNQERSAAVRDGGLGLGTLAAGGLLATGFGTALTSLIASPASAQSPMDVQILQTASSLEILAVATYKAAMGLPFWGQTPAAVQKFAQTTMMQHDEHRQAFQAQTKALNGKEQDQPNPKYLQVVNDAKPMLTDAGAVVTLAMSLEQVATETYLANLSLLGDSKSKEIMASIMGVESQHLATLRAVDALLKGGAPQLIAIPTDLASLPAAAGSVAFPEPFEPITKASPPEEGAVK